MSALARRVCPVCQIKFDPIQSHQVCCTREHANVLRVRRCRARKRGGGDDGGGPRQRVLFPKPLLVKSKPPKPAPVTQPALFEGELIATHGGTLRYGADGSPSDNIPFQVLRKTGRKPAISEPLTAGANHAA